MAWSVSTQQDMFIKRTRRNEDDKTHHYGSVVENHRRRPQRSAQREVSTGVRSKTARRPHGVKASMPRWDELFGVACDVLPYDLTSTAFESDTARGEEDRR